MPSPGLIWWHLILNTHCSWLHGDPRGFRSRDHRIHSSGDYKHRPPPAEHEGLRRFHQQRSQPAIRIPQHLQPIIGERIVSKARDQGYRLLCCPAVSRTPMVWWNWRTITCWQRRSWPHGSRRVRMR
ncbi:MAG: hypothetical protein IT445_08250 [Phycisphaeraceae bacterium]|nr:hypothetical protein [Phycisphaeraceae bacterium]